MKTFWVVLTTSKGYLKVKTWLDLVIKTDENYLTKVGHEVLFKYESCTVYMTSKFQLPKCYQKYSGSIQTSAY